MKIETRDQILLEALPLFLENGVSGVRVGDICTAAGVSNGSLFHFFPNKEAIAVALYVGAIESYHGALLRELAPERSAEQGVRGIVKGHWVWVAANESKARFLFEMGRPNWHAEAGRQTKALNDKVEAAYGAWWRAHCSRKSVISMPLPAARAILLGPSMMALRHWLRDGGGSPQKFAKCFADAAVAALVKGEC